MQFNIPGLSHGQGAIASNAVVDHAQTANSDSSKSVNSQDLEKREKGAAIDSSAELSDDDSINKVDATAPRGVQIAQAMTQVWSRRDLLLAYVL